MPEINRNVLKFKPDAITFMSRDVSRLSDLYLSGVGVISENYWRERGRHQIGSFKL